MTRVAAVLTLLAASACVHPSDRDPRQILESGRLAILRGELPRAQALASHGLSLTEADRTSRWPWEFRLLSAEILLAKRELPAARSLLDAVMPPDPGLDSLRGRQLFLRARVKLAERQLKEALLLSDDALASAADDRGLRLDIGAFQGQVLFQLERWDDAERRLNEIALRAAEANDRYHEAFALHQLGTGQLVRNRWDQALALFERVLSFSDLAEMTIYSAALNNAGICYSRLGLFDRAIAVQRRAIDSFAGRGAPTEHAQALGTLGNTYLIRMPFKPVLDSSDELRRGDARTGVSYLQQSIKVANDAHLTSAAAVNAGNLAEAFIELEQWDAAARANEEAKALRSLAGGGAFVYNTLNSAKIAAGLKRFDEAARLFEEVVASPQATPALLWEAHALLASVAVALDQPARASREFEAALNVIETTRAGLLKPDYKLSYLAQLISFYQGYVEMLVQRGQADRALEIADASRGRILAERQGVEAPRRSSVAAFRRLARESRSVLLFYWMTPAKSSLWIVGPDGTARVTLPPAGEIDRLVGEHQKTIANVLADPLAAGDTAGDKLYRLLVAPASRWLTPGTPVIIVPDGSLHGINFETLPVDGARRHYWIEDTEVQIAPSLSSLAVTRPGRARAASLLLMGNATSHSPEFPPLRYASIEMSSIAKHFDTDQVQVYDGGGASPAAYRAARPDRFSFIHFTAHATANVESPLDSAVILSGPELGFKLYARDVAAQPLEAELVTVSACRSAGERAYAGEGLVGFSWAFLRAGARRVIAGLWDVDDRSTAELMDRVYAGLRAGESPSHALRSAKLSLVRQGGSLARPYNWGPFEVFTVTP
jgi:tetratricopeptide (TPR) repeat protein